MQYLIYTSQKSQPVFIPDERSDIIADTEQCLTVHCSQDYAAEGVIKK